MLNYAEFRDSEAKPCYSSQGLIGFRVSGFRVLGALGFEGSFPLLGPLVCGGTSKGLHEGAVRGFIRVKGFRV